MLLSDFEHDIDPKVLARGQEYYRTGRVLSIKEKNGAFLARVEGSEQYRVELELSGEREIRYSICTCPYDQGEFCKHQVAVFLALREQPLPKTISTEKTKSEKSLESLVESAPRQVLEEFLLSLAEEHPFIKKSLKLKLGEKTVDEELKECKALIRSTINANGGRRGFVEYRQVQSALMGADTVSTRALKHFEAQEYYRAFSLSLCILQEMLNLIAMSDDSSGYIGSVIAESLDILDDSVSELSGSESDQAFKTLLKEFSHSRHEAYNDPQVAILHLLASMTDTPKRRIALEGIIDDLVRKESQRDYHSRHFEEEMAIIRYQLLVKFQELEAARIYLNENIHLPGIRSMVINQAIERHDYSLAEKICLDGEESDREYAGLVDKWRKLRALVYSRTSRLDEWRTLARAFAIDGSFDFYDDYKSSFLVEEWQTLYEDFLQQIKERQRWNNFYPQILIAENRLDLLLDHVIQHPNWIVTYSGTLHPFNPNAVKEIYTRYIEFHAQQADQRSKYKNVVELLKKFAGVCGSEEAQKLRDAFLLKYPRRPAMQDELKRVKL